MHDPVYAAAIERSRSELVHWGQSRSRVDPDVIFDVWLAGGLRHTSKEAAEAHMAKIGRWAAEDAAHRRKLAAPVAGTHTPAGLTTGLWWPNEDGEIEAEVVSLTGEFSSLVVEDYRRREGEASVLAWMRRWARIVADCSTRATSDREHRLAGALFAVASTRLNLGSLPRLTPPSRPDITTAYNDLSIAAVIEPGMEIHSNNDVWADGDADAGQVRRTGGLVTSVDSSQQGRTFTTLRLYQRGAPGGMRIAHVAQRDVHSCNVTGCPWCPLPPAPGALRKAHRTLHGIVARGRSRSALNTPERHALLVAEQIRRHDTPTIE